jgi:hypothetical protein
VSPDTFHTNGVCLVLRRLLHRIMHTTPMFNFNVCGGGFTGMHCLQYTMQTPCMTVYC